MKSPLIVIEPMKKKGSEPDTENDMLLDLSRDFVKAVKGGKPEDVAMIFTEMVNCCMDEDYSEVEE